jgi:site-specific recombinase XerD
MLSDTLTGQPSEARIVAKQMVGAGAPATGSAAPIPALAESFRRALLAENKSPRTVQTYLESIARFVTFLERERLPLSAATIRREHIEAFITDLLARFRATTASVRYRGLQTFFRWLVAEGELEVNPMARMRPPQVPEDPPDVLADDEIRRLIAASDGCSFLDRRDQAIVRLLLDTGMRSPSWPGSERPTSIGRRTLPS